MERSKIKHFPDSHFLGVTKDGRKFVYCPIGHIVSWHPGDYDNKYCAWCIMYFDEPELK